MRRYFPLAILASLLPVLACAGNLTGYVHARFPSDFARSPESTAVHTCVALKTKGKGTRPERLSPGTGGLIDGREPVHWFLRRGRSDREPL